MYLLDTAVLLDLRKARSGAADPKLAAWAGGVPREQLFVSMLTLAEIEAYAARAPGGEAGRPSADGSTHSWSPPSATICCRSTWPSRGGEGR